MGEIDITQDDPLVYTRMLCSAGEILNLVKAPSSIWLLREEDEEVLSTADPAQWYRVDLFYNPRRQ